MFLCFLRIYLFSILITLEVVILMYSTKRYTKKHFSTSQKNDHERKCNKYCCYILNVSYVNCLLTDNYIIDRRQKLAISPQMC